MSYTVYITDLAGKQVEEGYNYYEDKSTGLGESFLGELDKRYIDLSLHPEYYSFIDNRKLLRDVKIKRFPYVIIYEITGSQVVILYVHNTSERPPNT